MRRSRLVVPFTLGGRTHLVPGADLAELERELDRLSDETLNERLTLACLSTKAILGAAIDSDSRTPSLGLLAEEQLMLVAAIGNLLSRGDAGPELEQLRDEIAAAGD